MPSEARETHHHSDTRNVDVSMPARSCTAAGDAYGGDYFVRVAFIASYTDGTVPYSPPRLSFRDNMEQGYPVALTREQWEELKREVDQAWGTFERTWPPTCRVCGLPGDAHLGRWCEGGRAEPST